MEARLEMNPIEAEVDAIRQKIYSETKNMTLEERREYLIKRTDPIIKMYGLKISRLKPVKPHKRPPEEEDY